MVLIVLQELSLKMIMLLIIRENMHLLNLGLMELQGLLNQIMEEILIAIIKIVMQQLII